MQTQYDRSSRQRRSLLSVLVILLLLLTALSCAREEAVLLNVTGTTSVEGEAEVLEVTFSLSTKEEVIQTSVEASDLRSRWTLSASPDKSGLFTIGPLSMGVGVALPEGEYTLQAMLDDGQLLSERFSVRRP